MLWQRLLEWARYLLKHKQQTERNTSDIKKQSESFDEMVEVVRGLTIELARLRDNEAHEREKLALRLENILLRERASLPAPTKPGAEVEELLQQIEALKR